MPLTPHQHLTNAIPNWLGNASQRRRAQLKSFKPGALHAYSNLKDGHHRALKALNGAAWAAQNPVDRALENLQNPNDFARPRLHQAIKQRFALDLDVDLTHIRLYIPATIPWFPVRSGAARTWTATLLEAALHNFQPDEARANAHEASSTYLQGGVTLPAVVAKMSIQQFIQLCRELDIGGQYQAYLQAQLREPVASAVLRQQVGAGHKATLKAAVLMAKLTGDISSALAQLVEGLADGVQGLRLDGVPWQAHDLSLMSATLTGVVVFAQDLYLSRQAVPVVAYIPDDPEYPLKQYPSSAALMQDLTRKLRSADYQQFFTRFVAHAERPFFFANLNQRLSSVTWHPHVAGDPLPSWRETPATRAHLQFAANAVRGDLLVHLYQQKLNKVLNDAADIAISTASADRTARWAKWDALKDIALSLVQIAALIAAPFFPPLGALMLGYTAYQLLDETFEGIIDWAEGLKTEAFGHLMGLMETLVQLGLFAAGLPIAETLLRPALPPALLDFIDTLKPIQRTNGEARLWKPDLAPYDQGPLPAGARPDALGLYTKGGQHIVALPQGNIAVKAVGETPVFRAQHPRRSNAYQPLLSHNGAGAWRSELDRPLSWSDDHLLQRLGPRANRLPLETLKQLCRLSQTDSTHLRKMHLDSEALPPLLDDEIQRFTLDQDLQTFIDQMHSDDPLIHTRADAQTQLQLLTSYHLWPEGIALRFFSEQGEILWQYTPQGRHPVVQIHAAQLQNGHLLETLLNNLDEPHIRTLLDEPVGQPAQALSVRAAALRKKLARLAEQKRSSLFEARYRGLNATQDPAVQVLMDSQTGLPASLAEELLRSATADELKQLGSGRIPQRLRDLARWARQEVRVTRAYEGLYLKSADNPDTDRLALHSLPRLPDWSGDVRIEVKRQAGSDVLHDSIGSPTARLRKTLIINDQGQYAVYDAVGRHLFGFTDLYRAILQAVPDTERDALGLNIAEGEKLRQRLRGSALTRDEVRALLLEHPVTKPAYDPKTMRLPGGMEGYASATADALEAQAQHLFPALSSQQRQALLQHFDSQPEGCARTLARLRHEFTQLQHDLDHWVASTPQLYPDSEVRLSREDFRNAKKCRQDWAAALKRGWRRETSPDLAAAAPGMFKLEFPAPLPGELPTLNLRLEHVSLLTLEGDHTTQGVPAFLRHFPALRHLSLRNMPLADIPPAVFDMPRLTQLALRNCEISLSHSSHAALALMNRLEVLDLYANPLGRTPAVGGMTELTYLDLTGTGISTLPEGLLNCLKLDTVILRDNRITELPDALLDMSTDASDIFDFYRNPLSRATLERVKLLRQRTGAVWEVEAPAPDIARTQALYPTFSHEEASRFVLGIPGDLAAGERALAQLQKDYLTLQNDLEQWVVAQPVEHLGVAVDEQTAAQEQGKRALFKLLLEQAWRRECEVDDVADIPQVTHQLVFSTPIMGELPALRANFDHISAIKLDCSHLTTGVDAFLNSFSKLNRLSIKRARLGDIPPAVFRMSRLRVLTLSRCDLQPSASSLQALASMDKLRYLDLQYNPQLTRAPDLSQMPELGVISLYRCAVTDLPEGLLSRPRLVLADLRNNQISDIPPAFFDAPRDIANSVFLYGNPLSNAGMQHMVRFARQTGINPLRTMAEADVPLVAIAILEE